MLLKTVVTEEKIDKLDFMKITASQEVCHPQYLPNLDVQVHAVYSQRDTDIHRDVQGRQTAHVLLGDTLKAAPKHRETVDTHSACLPRDAAFIIVVKIYKTLTL